MSIINTDIYNIADITEQIKSNFIDESSDTLAASTLGFISAISADTAREAIRVSAKMANEAIYSKATLQSSIITHAMVLGIDGVFATPGVMKAKLVLNESDILKIMGDSNTVTIDHLWKIMIDDFEFHLDYDIILTRTTISGNKNVYSARYDTSIKNKLSNITNPYIDPPNTIIMDNGITAIAFNVLIRQTYYTTFYKKYISNNIIDNKTFLFEFENKLCNFTIKVQTGNTITRVEPVYEGTNPTSNIYCYYSFITSNKIRIKFDNEVFIPQLNSEITVEIFTSSGADSNFTYSTNFTSIMQSDNYDYKSTNVLFIPITDSINGKDQKSAAQLQALLPIEATSRGSIGNDEDLTARFNLENTDSSRILFKDKTINQFENSYYTYLALKDDNNNMIPTNTIDLKIPYDQFDTINSSVGYNRYVMKQGCYILSDGNNAEVKLNPTYKELKEAKFIYTTPLTCAITDSQLQTSYYMSMVDDEYELVYDYINDQSNLQFVTTNIQWRRKYLENPNTYSLSFQLTQNITSDMGMIIEDISGIICNIKVIVLLYKNNKAYRYKVAELTDYDLSAYTFQFNTDFESTDLINEDNNIRIDNVNLINQDETEFDYGYFDANTQVKIYVLYKGDAEYGRYDLDDYVPGLFGYSVSNMYSIDGGIYFFKNYSSIISSIVDPINITRQKEIDMDWDIKYLRDYSVCYTNEGYLYIPYMVKKDTNITLTITDQSTNKVIYKEYTNQVSASEDVYNSKWNLRDYSTLSTSGITYPELHYDENGNYVYYEGDENRVEIVKKISESKTRIINENTTVTIRVESSSNFFELEHKFTKDDINKFLEGTTLLRSIGNYLDYNIINFTTPDYSTETVQGYRLSSVPVLRRSYLDKESKVQYIVDTLNKKKDFITESNNLLRSPFTVDLKFVNTYGPSKLYTTKNGLLDRVNLSLKFDLKLKTNADKNVVTYIIDDIKNIIESINKDLDNIHMKVIEDTIINSYSNAIVYIECMQINNYDQTVNHLYLSDYTNNSDIPEFICINTIGDDNSEPDITITLV